MELSQVVQRHRRRWKGEVARSPAPVKSLLAKRPPDKAALSESTASHVAQFLAGGGRIRAFLILTEEERKTADQRWTNSLGPLTKPRKRKQGEHCVSPGWQDKPAGELLTRPGKGRQKKPYRCADCQSTDEAKRAGTQHLCRRCDGARRKAKRTEKARLLGKHVRLTKDDEVRSFRFISEAGRFLGVTHDVVSAALKRGRRVLGWSVERVEP